MSTNSDNEDRESVSQESERDSDVGDHGYQSNRDSEYDYEGNNSAEDDNESFQEVLAQERQHAANGTGTNGPLVAELGPTTRNDHSESVEFQTGTSLNGYSNTKHQDSVHETNEVPNKQPNGAQNAAANGHLERMMSVQLNDDPGTLDELSNVPYTQKSFFGKHGKTMKTLIPVRCGEKDKEYIQNQNVGLFSFVSIFWMDKWMWKASRKGVEPNKVGKINERDGVYHNNQRLTRLWREEVRKKGKDKASFIRTIMRFNRFSLCMSALMMTVTCILAFVGPAWILRNLLNYLDEREQNDPNNPPAPTWYGYLLVVEMSVTQFFRNAAFSCVWVVGAYSGIWAQGAVQVLVYDKVLKIKTGGEKLLAEVVNYSTTDIERIYQSMQLSMLIVGAPVMWIMNLVYCYLVLGVWSLLGNFLILSYYPIMAMVGRKTSSLRVTAVRFTDRRIRLMNQVLGSMKLIKMYAWEKAFSSKIKNIRSQEENILHKAAFLQSISWTGSPILATVAPMTSFIGMVLTGIPLISADAFTVSSVFTSLLIPMNTLPMAVKSFSEGIVSCRRIQSMLLAEEATLPDDKGITNPKHAISIVNANIGWTEALDPKMPQKIEKQIKRKLSNKHRRISGNVELVVAQSIDNIDSSPAPPPYSARDDISVVLSGINLIIERGQLVGICGNVGTGKSTLLSSISGDASIANGLVSKQGRIAYVTQQAWIFNATVRENILFGLPYDEERYKMVVYACCLETDFTLMPNADLTEIGERGANLSGGQKQRINLARALYSNRELYLLDDALSAVDVKVAKHIFEYCVQKALKMNGKTVLLVTHAMHLLEQCDLILLMKDGTISEKGTHEELIAMEKEYALMFRTDQEERSKQKDSQKKTKTGERDELPDVNEAPMVDTGMVKQEVDKHLSLTWKTWKYFCKQCGGYIVCILAFLTIVLFNLANIFNAVWLQTWMNAGGCLVNETDPCPKNFTTDDVTKNPDLNMYVGIYGGSGVLMLIFGLIKGLTVGKVMLTGASTLHHLMFWKIIRSPMSFFDVTPLGRIINRFSRDMDELDVQIPFVTEFCSQSLMMIAFQLILICVYFPWYTIALAIVLVIYFGFDIMLNGGVRATKRVDNLLRPPLLVHLSATVQGIPVIRCYQKQKMMAEKFRALVNKHLSAYLLFQLSSKWIAFRIDTLSWLVITVTGIFVVASKGVDASAAGLCMSQIFRVCAVLATVTRWKSELQARLISIERISEYCRELVEEAPSIVEPRPPNEWPKDGAISVNHAELRYRPDLPLVLHGLEVHIAGGEKVGIIGRTGAGKSSVIGTLLRLTELCGGNIVIDGIDIAKIGLEDLRSKLAVIPQEPILFEGTVRWNLDPFSVRTDDEIWDSLEKSHLKDKISKESAKLETVLDAEGGIFSLGEKQLFCLARALLRNSKILLLDEATASVDVETDRLIQATIRDSFSHCTVLTIAHRLNTIADYEKIMAMDAGKVVEFDSPANLLARESLFQSMMKSMNESGGH